MRERERGGERSPRHVHGSVSIETKRICYKRYCRWISIKPRVRSPLSTLRSPSLSLSLYLVRSPARHIHPKSIPSACETRETLDNSRFPRSPGLSRYVSPEIPRRSNLRTETAFHPALHCGLFLFYFFLPFIILEWFDRLIKILLCMLIFESRIN